MMAIKKEMIKKTENKNFLNDDYDELTFGLTDLRVFNRELSCFINVDVYSSIKIDQQAIIEKMKKLKGLKFKMLPVLLKNHIYIGERACFFEVDEEEQYGHDIKFDDEIIKILEGVRDETDQLLKDTVEEQIKNYFEVN